ncbi:related to 3-hydroxybutyryl-CoA dehydrogenase [Phialocephala subalpina]|uniref:Related to 3-hydroxybutyryl-CoA dehydrogenase n=1 Tax=Phialocephala subalpina TaxID=576137 RepID=A0A1L7XBD1_9HELO|nr:related to 3-hydroxybutyryl-CoA dehydrogenase [Phialocephala subalpina]
MGDSGPSGHIAVIGCGSIGAGWAALFAAHGHTTRVYDPNPSAETFLHTIVSEAVRVLHQLGHFNSSPSSNHLKDVSARITFTMNLSSTLQDATFVQENGPEDLATKTDLLRALDATLDASIPILTSTSGLTCSSMQSFLTNHPSRFAIGHPFNPPHLIPLVEIVGGSQTSHSTLEHAKSFYTSLGRKPIVLKHEIPGHIANRLQSALLREILYLMKEDIARIDDIETAMEFGPGLRWGVMGPSLLMHLGGGLGGAAYYAEKLLGPLLTWNAPDTLVVDDELRKKWVAQTIDVVGNETYISLSRKRDAGIVNTLKWRQSLPETQE